MKNICKETYESIALLVSSIAQTIIAYSIFGAIIMAIACVLYRMPSFVDWLYDDTGIGKASVQVSALYPEEWLQVWETQDTLSWGPTQIVYGDYYAAKERAIAEQCIAECKGEHLETIHVNTRNGWYTFDAYDMGKDESEYEWHDGESYVALPITTPLSEMFTDVKMDAYNSIYYSDMVCSIEDKVYPYTSHEVDEVLSDIDLIFYDGIVRSNKDELNIDIEYIKHDSVALLKSLVG